MLDIRRAKSSDIEAIWSIFQDVVRDGTTFPYRADTTKNDFVSIWFAKNSTVYVALKDDEVVGSYVIKALWPGAGAHVAHGSYMVSPLNRGEGIGLALGQHSLDEARKSGYLAMQFNLVVSTNRSAVKLWQKLGFKIVGTLPEVFKHPQMGYVDAYVMHRLLN
jgi:L-amino acid N-acyltransferase YncA